ncbi:unnamed protein product [Ectocarpus fasciculatus]
MLEEELRHEGITPPAQHEGRRSIRPGAIPDSVKNPCWSRPRPRTGQRVRTQHWAAGTLGVHSPESSLQRWGPKGHPWTGHEINAHEVPTVATSTYVEFATAYQPRT